VKTSSPKLLHHLNLAHSRREKLWKAADPRNYVSMRGQNKNRGYPPARRIL